MAAQWFLALSPLIDVALAYAVLYASHVSRLKRIHVDLPLPPDVHDPALTDAILPLLRQKHEEFKVDFERAKAEIEAKIEADKIARDEQRDTALSNLRTAIKE